MSQVIPVSNFIKPEAETTIVACLETACKKFANHIAIDDGIRQITYKELNEESNRLAHAILGVLGEGQEPIGFVLEQSVGVAFVALLAILKAGKAYVALDPSNPSDRLRSILDDLKPRLVLTDTAHHDLVEKISNSTIQILNLEHLQLESFSRENPSIYPNSGGIATIFYTSGSTGVPKGLMRNHRMTVWTALGEIKKQSLSPDDRQPLQISLSFGPSGPMMFSIWLSGGVLLPVNFRDQSAVDIVNWLLEKKITTALFFPGMLRTLFDVISRDQVSLPDLRCIVTGGEALQMRDIQIWQTLFSPSSILYYAFASTEAQYTAYRFFTKESKVSAKELNFNKIDEDKQIFILDDEGNELPVGDAGRIVIRSRYLCSGYWNQPELSAQSFVAVHDDPVIEDFYSNDMGRILPDGSLEFIGRKDNMVKVRGYRIDLSDIESALYKIPMVQGAVVLYRSHPDRPEIKHLIAYVVPEVGTDLNNQLIRQSLTKTLPGYMVPSYIILLEKFPYNLNNKIDKKALPHVDMKRALSAGDRPIDEIEQRLLKIWKSVLKLKHIGVQDNFFDLGGDSLLAMDLLLKIEDEFSQRMPLAVISQASNIRQQASLLRLDDVAKYASVLIPIRTTGVGSPIFCIGGKGGNPIRFHRLTRYLSENHPVYFFRSRGFEPGEKIQASIESIASDYLREVKKIQAKGPYYFFGESGGGMVAYEIAQQLSDAHEKTALVVMFDTYLEEVDDIFKKRKPNYWNRLKKHWQTITRGGLTSLLSYYPSLWRYKYLEWVELRRVRSLFKRLGQRSEVYTRIEESNIAAGRVYRPRAYDGDVIMFSAARQLIFTGARPDHGWKDAGAQNIQVYQLDCYHGNILFEPFVQRVAEIIRDTMLATG